ncbi:unnamed protein product [Pseudo-nitzschia multistriata]|uniref:Uncharacterized protein n=1 Tax=Pseudo-nitzschia multistriata TaxID=183589 RepID=A0A448ZN78_9STRA|nr:unnamed protein product [Pseudo-nitzschia multistriata]
MTRLSTPPKSKNRLGIADSNVRPIEGNRRSQNIPLPMSHMHRTQSEVQLCEDMETAEQRDLNMFYRVVNGIRDRQMQLVRENKSSVAAAAFYNPAHGLTEAERSLAHIIHTRNAPLDRKNGRDNSSNNARRTNLNLIGASNPQQIHTGLNSGVPILEDHSECDLMEHEKESYERTGAEDNEWSVAGFDNDSPNTKMSLDSRQNEHYQYHQNLYQQESTVYHDQGVSAAAPMYEKPTNTLSTATLNPSRSSSNIVDEGMFDFEL